MPVSETSSAARDRILAFRLGSHHLSQRLPAGSLHAAAGICGVQNTPPGTAGLALNARLTGLTPEELDRALYVDKTLLQQWSLRASPYIFPTQSAAVFTRGLLPTDEQALRFFITGVEAALDKIGISAVRVVELSAAGLLEILDGRALTKDELGIEISEWVRPHLAADQAAAWLSPSLYASGQSLGESVVRFALPILALQGVCCHAERQGNQAFFRLTSQWLGGSLPEQDPQESCAELVRRYLHCYGPSVPKHFAEWAGIAPVQADQSWKLVQDEMCEVDFGGKICWLLERDLSRFESPPVPAGIRFLPPHDPYLGLRDRATLVPDRAMQRQFWRTSGNPGALLSCGQLIAMWRPQKKGSRLSINITTFDSLPPGTRDQVEAEAATLAPFKGYQSVSVAFTGYTA